MLRFIFISLLCVLLSACLFPKKAGKGLAHFASESPVIGAAAPKFTVEKLNGDTIKLDDLIGEKPIVLQLGSHSCPVYRYRRFSMSKLYRNYADKAHFLLVYTIEAHPKGSISPYSDKEWVSSFNYLTGTLIPQAQNMQERVARAKWSNKKLQMSYDIAVDNMQDEIWRAYGRAPSAAFVIDLEGHIVAKMPWVDPSIIKVSIDSIIENKAIPE